MVPAAGSGVPGAPADWEPPDGIEQHTPVLFLDLNADDLSTGNCVVMNRKNSKIKCSYICMLIYKLSI